jgi:hypothetical protein
MFWSICLVAGIALVVARILLPRWGWFMRSTLRIALKGSCLYPRSSSFKDLDSPALVEARDFRDIDWGNAHLRYPRHELRPLVDTLIANERDFFLDQVDVAVLSDMGMPVIAVRLEKKKHDRSLYIDIPAFIETMRLKFRLAEVAIASFVGMSMCYALIVTQYY